MAQVFAAEGKGWGLRTSGRLLAGTFVVEYTGEAIRLALADEREKR